ncbi:MAG: GTP 3',8-cyclase MoaA [Spirochaetaceae bacterium]|nr:GTP 3',8-cyclase MoaA [Spirochaetaceae bacterium]
MSASTVRDAFSRPLRDLRISVIDRCNFRCPYCMPKDTYGDDYQFLPPADYLSFAEVARLVRLFVAHGVTKVRLTGGEPLLRPRLPELVAALARIPGIEDLALTTNGYRLAEHADALHAAGLRRVTVSLDSVDEEVFARMNGLGIPIDRVLAGIARAQQAGLAPVKLNTVVQRGVNDHTVPDLVRRFAGQPIAIRFIEYMDVGNRNGWNPAGVVPSAELKAALEEEFALQPVAAAYRGEVAQRYRIAGTGTEVGFVSSISQPFCSDCSRARLSTDGHFYTCLFAWQGTDLRTPLRGGASDRDLADLLAGVWRRRVDRYSEERAEVTRFERNRERKIEMYQIGG